MAEFISKNRIFDLIHAVNSVHGFTSYEDYVGLLKDVEASTNADVQLVKHGKWEYYKNNGIFDIHKCTLCGEKYEMYMDIEPTTIYKYCPNCGARMIKDGEQND